MKIKKRITIVADILVDEDFNPNLLCICELEETGFGNPDVFVGRSENFEVLDYVSQEAIEMVVENPLDTITDNAFELGDKSDET